MSNAFLFFPSLPTPCFHKIANSTRTRLLVAPAWQWPARLPRRSRSPTPSGSPPGCTIAWEQKQGPELGTEKRLVDRTTGKGGVAVIPDRAVAGGFEACQVRVGVNHTRPWARSSTGCQARRLTGCSTARWEREKGDGLLRVCKNRNVTECARRHQ